MISRGCHYVIGLDGADFAVLGRFDLPSISGLAAGGVSGLLESVTPPQTAPAWTSFRTGCLPGATGIYDFTRPVPGQYKERPVTGDDCLLPSFWELPACANMRTLALNIPLTHPARRLNGSLVTGFMTPGSRLDASWPPDLLSRLEAELGRYPFYLETRSDDPDEFFDAIGGMLDYKSRVFESMTAAEDYDFAIIHIWGTDRLAHAMWDLLATDDPGKLSEQRRRLYGRAAEYLSQVDEFVGNTARNLGPEDTLWIISDHGFGTATHGVDLNVWLYENGYLALRNSPGARFRRAAWRRGFNPSALLARKAAGDKRKADKAIRKRRRRKRLKIPVRPRPMTDVLAVLTARRRLFLSMADVDWSKTTAYSPFGLGHIRLNLKGREPQGPVEPGPDEKRTLHRLRKDLERMPLESAPDEVAYPRAVPAADLFGPDRASGGPDLYFISHDSGFLALNVFSFSSSRPVSKLPDGYGYHRQNGILIAAGKNLGKGCRIEGAGIIDIAPTLMHMAGAAAPVDMDGKILVAALDPEFAASRPPERSGRMPFPAGSADGAAEPESEELLERLKGLGYVGD